MHWCMGRAAGIGREAGKKEIHTRVISGHGVQKCPRGTAQLPPVHRAPRVHIRVHCLPGEEKGRRVASENKGRGTAL